MLCIVAFPYVAGTSYSKRKYLFLFWGCCRYDQGRCDLWPWTCLKASVLKIIFVVIQWDNRYRCKSADPGKDAYIHYEIHCRTRGRCTYTLWNKLRIQERMHHISYKIHKWSLALGKIGAQRRKAGMIRSWKQSWKTFNWVIERWRWVNETNREQSTNDPLMALFYCFIERMARKWTEEDEYTVIFRTNLLQWFPMLNGYKVCSGIQFFTLEKHFRWLL